MYTIVVTYYNGSEQTLKVVDSLEEVLSVFDEQIERFHLSGQHVTLSLLNDSHIVLRRVDADTLQEDNKVKRDFNEELKRVACKERTSSSQKRIVQKTIDGSTTLYVYELDEHYHSTNGAIQEAQHIYIEKAYHFSSVQHPVVFEVGFGTGLNTLMTALEAEKTKRETHYVSIEKYPLSADEVAHLNYTSLFGEQSKQLFLNIHQCEWGKESQISEFFYLTKIHADLTTLPEIPMADVIYFDAFAPNKQESMWSEDIFKHLFVHLNSGGVMTTYCAQGRVRRMLQSVGFEVERTDGPIGKREMLRATRTL